MIKYTKVACMLDRSSGTLSQIFTTVVKSKLQKGIISEESNGTTPVEKVNNILY